MTQGDAGLPTSRRRTALYILDRAGVVCSASSSACGVAGIGPAEIIGAPLPFSFSAGSVAPDASSVLEMAADRGGVDFEGRLTSRSGREFWASVSVEPLVGEASKTGGFALRVREAELNDGAHTRWEQTSHELRMFHESVVHCAMYALDVNGHVRTWNPGAQRTKGYSREDIIGKHYSVFFTEEDVAASKPVRALEIARLAGRFEGEGWRVRRDGTKFWASVVLEPILDENRVLVGFAKFTRDISERLALEEAKQRLLESELTAREEIERRLLQVQHELVQAHRLTALGEMGSTLAHELNQPLTAIVNYLRGASRLLTHETSTRRDDIREAIDAAAEQALRAGDVIKHVREFIAHGSVERETASLHRLIHDALQIAALVSDNSPVVTSLDLSPASDMVAMDRVQVQQVLLNLIRNAYEAMSDCPLRELKISAALSPDSNHVVVSVADSGRGIEEAMLDKLFAAFATSKSMGMGLGLSVCRTIVESHGGRIWVERPIDHTGAVFRFTLLTA